MAHLPMDDAQTLFDANKEKSWSGLHQVLQQRKGKAEGISDNLVGMMMPISEHMMKSNQPYPNSAQELDNAINQELAKVTA